MIRTAVNGSGGHLIVAGVFPFRREADLEYTISM
jgi:hypothetical protein